MYTNTGIFQTMNISDIGKSAAATQEILNAVVAGNITVSSEQFETLSKFEEDIMAHIVHLAELHGRTNVCSDSMSFP